LEIKHIHERLGVTVVYVTHDQTEALTMSSRIAVFNDGQIQQLSTPEDLYERPGNAFVARFIGENNTLIGTVLDSDPTGIATLRLATGEVLRAKAVDRLPKGSQALLSIRPERIDLSIGDNPSEAHLPGVIEELIYLGDHIRIRLTVAGNSNFTVKISNRMLNPLFVKGCAVTVHWKASDGRAMVPDVRA
jgi:putative spermidine/putrescine transport system ATP-binding protein